MLKFPLRRYLISPILKRIVNFLCKESVHSKNKKFKRRLLHFDEGSFYGILDVSFCRNKLYIETKLA